MGDCPELNSVPYSGFGTLKLKLIIYPVTKISLNFGDAAEDAHARELALQTVGTREQEGKTTVRWRRLWGGNEDNEVEALARETSSGVVLWCKLGGWAQPQLMANKTTGVRGKGGI